MKREAPDPSDDLRREAQHWIVRLRAGQVGPAEIEALGQWRATSPSHRRAFAEAGLSFDVARSAALNLAETAGIESLYEDGLSASKRRRTRRAVLGGAALAAAACGAYVAVNPPFELWPSPSEMLADYRTASGEQRRLSFAGDVAVEMNTRTSLAVGPAQAQARQIELIAGEIAVTAASPFAVIAGVGRTTAQQASFDLRRDAHGASVTCLDGVVRVECGGGSAELQPHQRIAYDARGLSSIGSANVVMVESWRKGLLVFENRPLSEVIEEINRYRRGRIILLNSELAHLPLDATFRLDRIDEAVPKIAHVFGVTVRALPGGVVLLG